MCASAGDPYQQGDNPLARVTQRERFSGKEPSKCPCVRGITLPPVNLKPHESFA